MASKKDISITITYVEKKSSKIPNVAPEGEEKVKAKTQKQGVSALGSIVASESFKQAKTIIKNIGKVIIIASNDRIMSNNLLIYF